MTHPRWFLVGLWLGYQVANMKDKVVAVAFYVACACVLVLWAASVGLL